MDNTFQIARPPQTYDELYELIKVLWGITIPRTPVCPEHSTPFAALAEAYFAEAPVSVWVGSRGMGGKSRTLAYLTLTEAVLLGAEINLLGGSLEQSNNIASAMREGWDWKLAPKHMIERDNATRLKLSNNALVRPLTASERTVRGPHPQRLRLDEIDVMDLGILDSAMGQPMPGRGLDTQTVMSSTHQVPDGTMTEILTRAEEMGWPVHRWCYRETANEIDGWLSWDFINRKKQEVSAHMFSVEYDLQEPSVGNRAMDTAAVEAMFVDTDHPKAENGTIKSPIIRKNNVVESYIFEEPAFTGDYVIAADWAKEQDFTVISVWRTDQDRMRLVAYKRGQRFPWPVMVGWFNELMEHYHAKGIHDGTGVGGVVNDYIDRRSQSFLFTGRQRDEMLTEYIAAVERGLIESPRITSAYTAHKFASHESIYNIGVDSHLADEIASFALAWKKSGRKVRHVAPITMPRLGEGMTDDKVTDAYAPVSPWTNVGGKVGIRDMGVSSLTQSAYEDPMSSVPAVSPGWDLGL
jgi:hypothetical protein